MRQDKKTGDKPMVFRVLDGDFYEGNPRAWTNMSHHFLLAMLANKLNAEDGNEDFGKCCPGEDLLAKMMHCGSERRIDTSTVKRGLSWLQSHRYIRQVSKDGFPGRRYKSRYWKIIESGDPEAGSGYLDPKDFPKTEDLVPECIPVGNGGKVFRPLTGRVEEAGVQSAPEGVQSAPEGVQSAPEGVQSAPEGVQSASGRVANCTPIYYSNIPDNLLVSSSGSSPLDELIMRAMKLVVDGDACNEELKKRRHTFSRVIKDEDRISEYSRVMDLFEFRYSVVARNKMAYLVNMLKNPEKYSQEISDDASFPSRSSAQLVFSDDVRCMVDEIMGDSPFRRDRNTMNRLGTALSKALALDKDGALEVCYSHSAANPRNAGRERGELIINVIAALEGFVATAGGEDR